MIEVVVIIALLVFIAYQQYQHQEEKKSFIRAIMSKDVSEFANAEHTSKLSPDPEEEEIPNDVLLDEVGNEEFDKLIKKQLGRDE